MVGLLVGMFEDRLFACEFDRNRYDKKLGGGGKDLN